MVSRKKLIQFIKIPKIIDDCFLFYAQYPEHLPFKIKRVYFITSANPKLPRGYHAHKKTKQALFCIQGKIKLILDNGKKREQVTLENPGVGIYIPELTWHEMHSFGKNTILLVVASENFEPDDYIRDRRRLLKLAKL